MFWVIVEQIWLQKRPRNGSKWSTEYMYHICYYVSNCSSWSVVFEANLTAEPSLFAYMKYGSRRKVRPKIRHLAPLDDRACAFKEEWVYRGRKVPGSFCVDLCVFTTRHFMLSLTFLFVVMFFFQSYLALWTTCLGTMCFSPCICLFILHALLSVFCSSSLCQGLAAAFIDGVLWALHLTFITVDIFAALFNCTPMGRTSDWMMAPA